CSYSRQRRVAPAVKVRREDNRQAVKAKQHPVGRDKKVDQGQNDEHRQEQPQLLVGLGNLCQQLWFHFSAFRLPSVRLACVGSNVGCCHRPSVEGRPPKGYRPFGGDIETKSAAKGYRELPARRGSGYFNSVQPVSATVQLRKGDCWRENSTDPEIVP